MPLAPAGLANSVEKSYHLCKELGDVNNSLKYITETVRGMVLDRGIGANTPAWTWIDRPLFAADRSKYISDPKVFLAAFIISWII